MEHDEESSLPGLVAEDTPLECSQSEVTFLSSGGGTYSEVELDLYSSCPVQCSCSGEEGGLPCEDCRANTLISGTAQSFDGKVYFNIHFLSREREKKELMQVLFEEVRSGRKVCEGGAFHVPMGVGFYLGLASSLFLFEGVMEVLADIYTYIHILYIYILI